MFFESKKNKILRIFSNKQLWHDSFFTYNFLIAFTLFAIIWGEVIWALAALRGRMFLTLHYSIYFGVDWVGGVYNFLIFGGIASFVFFANNFAAALAYDKKRILSRFLSASSLFILLFMLAALSLILYINWQGPATL